MLDLCRELDDPSGTMARCLEVAAAVATVYCAGAPSARLLGAADALREVVGAPLPVHERQEHDRWVAATQKLIGSERFGELRAEGRSLSMQEAVRAACSGSKRDWPKD